MFQRLFMAREPKRIRRAAGISLLLFTIVFAGILVMAVAATANLYGTLDDPDELVAAMFRLHWPAGGVLLAVVVFALAMSTIDSMLLTVASLITRDAIRGLLGIQLTEQSEFAIARWTTVLFLGLGTVVVLTGIGRGAIVP